MVLLRGISIEGIEPDFERVENVLKSLQNEIRDLKMQNIDLSNEVALLKAEKVEPRIQTEDNLEGRVEKLEQLSKFKTLRTCQELASRGLTLSGLYEVDPDGDGIGQAPIQVYCDFQSNTTQVLHDKEDMIKIEKCPGVGCAVYKMNYFAPQEQIDALMALSGSCHQDLDFGCFMAPLRFDDVDQGFWTDRHGNPQFFFNGNNPGTHVCQCGEEQSCVDSTLDLVCNCDSKSPTWYSDNGRITAKDLLPIESFHYGPLEFDLERANVTIGRLTCTGEPPTPFGLQKITLLFIFPGSVQAPAQTVTCNSWKLQGSVSSGIYILQDENQAPRLGFCDMTIEGYLDAALEQSIGFEIEVFPDPGRIMFSAHKDNPSQIEFTGDLVYNHEVENVGQHLDLETGIFKSPMDGSFQFTFSGSGYTTGQIMSGFMSMAKDVLSYMKMLRYIQV